MTGVAWKKRYGDLRRLVHYMVGTPMDQSGQFNVSREWHNNGFRYYIWNNRAKNVIGIVTQLSEKVAVVEYRPNSWYAVPLIEAAKGLKIDTLLLRPSHHLREARYRFSSDIKMETPAKRRNNLKLIAKSVGTKNKMYDPFAKKGLKNAKRI